MVMRSRTPWREKLHPEQKPVVQSDGSRTALIPSPMLVAEALRMVPRGRLVTPKRLRERLARGAGADSCCPMTTGIFLSLLAGATEEAIAEGRRAIAPYWRVVDDQGRLMPKFPPGTEVQAAHLRAEGHRISPAGVVTDFAEALLRW